VKSSIAERNRCSREVHGSIGAVLGELLAALFSVLARQVSLHQRCMLARNLLVFASEVLWRFFREINGASGELGSMARISSMPA